MKRIFRHWATAAVITLAALAIEGQGCAKSPSHGSNAAAAPCAPSNYTKVTNTAPMPADFCAYTYLPFRVRLPDHPTQIDTANTTKLQTQYAPNSGPGSSKQGSTVMQTLGQKPTGPEQGNGNHPTYVASPTDPLVTADCVTNGSTTYGCSDMRGNSTFGTPAPHFRIPAWARPAGMHCTNCDVFMSVLQPNGDVVDIGGCRPARDWQDGDVLGAPWVVPGSPCLDRPYGFAYGNIMTDPGNNNGVINAGDAAAALPATYQEVVVLGEIRHAIHVYGGCFTGGRYPGTYAGECPDRGGIPVGAHLYLDMTRAEIDATPTSIIPAHMRVFAYAAHEHGMFALDTGDGTKWISSGFLIEDALPALQSGAITQSYWWDWFVAHGGAMTADKNLKLQTPIDWSQLASRMYVLQECYARGTCRDSIPETQVMTRLQMGQQPTKTAPGQVITPAVTVQVLNQNGQPYTTTPQPSVTVALGTSPSGGTLSGTRTQTAIGGVATFADLRVDLAGNGYTLVVSAGSGVTGATSVPFAITGQSQ